MSTTDEKNSENRKVVESESRSLQATNGDGEQSNSSSNCDSEQSVVHSSFASNASKTKRIKLRLTGACHSVVNNNTDRNHSLHAATAAKEDENKEEHDAGFSGEGQENEKLKLKLQSKSCQEDKGAFDLPFTDFYFTNQFTSNSGSNDKKTVLLVCGYLKRYRVYFPRNVIEHRVEHLVHMFYSDALECNNTSSGVVDNLPLPPARRKVIACTELKMRTMEQKSVQLDGINVDRDIDFEALLDELDVPVSPEAASRADLDIQCALQPTRNANLNVSANFPAMYDNNTRDFQMAHNEKTVHMAMGIALNNHLPSPYPSPPQLEQELVAMDPMPIALNYTPCYSPPASHVRYVYSYSSEELGGVDSLRQSHTPNYSFSPTCHDQEIDADPPVPVAIGNGNLFNLFNAYQAQSLQATSVLFPPASTTELKLRYRYPGFEEVYPTAETASAAVHAAAECGSPQHLPQHSHLGTGSDAVVLAPGQASLSALPCASMSPSSCACYVSHSPPPSAFLYPPPHSGFTHCPCSPVGCCPHSHGHCNNNHNNNNNDNRSNMNGNKHQNINDGFSLTAVRRVFRGHRGTPRQQKELQPFSGTGQHIGNLSNNQLRQPLKTITTRNNIPPPRAMTRNFNEMTVQGILRENFTIKQLVEYDLVHRLMKDKNGSRYLQESLRNGDKKDCEIAVGLLIAYFVGKPHLNLTLMAQHVYGNYLIQLLFSHGNDHHHHILLNHFMLGSILRLSKSKYGCRVVQQVLSAVTNKEYLTKLVQHFDAQCQAEDAQRNSMLKQQNKYPANGERIVSANSVLSRYLQCCNVNRVMQVMVELNLPYTVVKFIGDELERNLLHYSEETNACRVVQSFIKTYGDKLNVCKLLVNKSHLYLSEKVHGNYVIQRIIKKGEWYSQLPSMKEFRNKLIDDIFKENNLEHFSRNKHASNVIEECIRASTPKQIDSVVNVLCRKQGYLLNVLMKDKFGNYIPKTLLDHCSNQQQCTIVDTIHQYITNLYHFHHGSFRHCSELILKCQKIKHQMDKNAYVQ